MVQYDFKIPQVNLETFYNQTLDLISDVGLRIDHGPFCELLEGKKNLTVRSNRVYLDRDYVKQEVEKTRAELNKKASVAKNPQPKKWSLSNGGWSMQVADITSGVIRDATCDDLRQFINLAESYGCRGPTPVYPQDVAPLLREVAAFKLCYQFSAGGIDGSLYSHPRQAPFIYDMAQTVGRNFFVSVSVAQPLHLVSSDLDNFMQFYNSDKKFKARLICYNLPGITGPITPLGSAMLFCAEYWAASLVFKAVDERFFMGLPAPAMSSTVDFINCCWAFGSPRMHLSNYIQHLFADWYAGVERPFAPASAALATASAQSDYQAGVEKLASGLVPALSGATNMTGLGNLCVDDIFSPVQFVLDLETVEYIKELVSAFKPSDVFGDVEGMSEAIRDVVAGNSDFVSHATTATRCRSMYPSSNIFARRKLPSFLADMKTATNRAAEVAKEKMSKPCFTLAADRTNELERIYAAAQKSLS